MKMTKQEFFIAEDIIEISGADSLKRLGQTGNVVYLNNIDTIEQRADDPSNPSSLQYQEVLDYISKGYKIAEDKKEEGEEIPDNVVPLPSGGKVIFDKEAYEKRKKNTQHITRKKGLQHKLKREGLPHEFPDFLKYGTDIFSEGLLDIDYDDIDLKKVAELHKNPKGLRVDQVEDILDRELFNNQIIKLNDGLFYKVEYALNESEGKYEIDENNSRLVQISPTNFNHYGQIHGFVPRTLEQKLAAQQLMDPNIEVHVVVGGSGSGKTVATYATALSQILTSPDEKKKGKKKFGSIMIFKTNDIIGGKDREQGFLPGTAFEKVKPFMQSYMDAHRQLGYSKELPFRELLADPFDAEDEFGKRGQDSFQGSKLPSDHRAIEVGHLQYARGRTFEDTLVIVDEAQNYTPFEIKQLIERVGVGSKIYLVGDPMQVDNPKLSPDFNGLVYATNVLFGDHPRMSISLFDKNFRSQSAEIMRGRKAPQI